MKKLAVILFIIFTLQLSGQNKLRVMTYNILNYKANGTVTTTKNQNLKKIITAVNPDILVVQEIDGSTYVNKFYTDVLNSTYKKATFIDGFDTDNAMYYRDSLISFLSNVRIQTDLRDISKFTVVYKATSDTLIIYSVHLKASSGSSNEQKRASEVTDLRNSTDQLHPGANFIVIGDYNIYSSSEPAFQKLIDKSKPGYFLDPVNSIGNWHNNSNYRIVHSQSTRSTQISDGGSSGGLDDRFDMILISQAVKDSGGISYEPGTYKVFGNDGNHFNKSINELPNNAVSDDLANALYFASDHLPVYADFRMDPVVSVREENNVIPKSIVLSQNYPNPFNPTTTIKYSIKTPLNPPFAKGGNTRGVFITLKVYDVLGREVATLVNQRQKPGNYEVDFNAEGLSSGIYFYLLKTENRILAKKMQLLK